MHFEILVEDVSGKKLLEYIIPNLIDLEKNTFKIIEYKGIGRLPKDLKTHQDPAKRILLEQLPKILRGYGKSFQNYNAIVIIVCDLDSRVYTDFKSELIALLESCDPKPNAFFRIAIEEMESWLLGDKNAIEQAYPKYNKKEYGTYIQESIVGTWEKLADILYPGGSQRLRKLPFFEIGKQKSVWAENIGRYMNVHNNKSCSFNTFTKLIIANSEE